MTKLMPWVGGKAQLMWAIQMLLPTHYKTLVDVFGGSGIITMNTSVPSGCLQIYNDLNHDLYNLLFCAKERPLELVRELGFLPINAHDEFDVLQRQLRGEDFTMEYMERQLDLTEVFFEPPQAEVVRQLLLERGSLGNVRRAAAFYKLQRYSYNGSGDSYGVGSCDIRRFFRDLWECSHRLKDAVLENKDFESIITARNDPQTVVYCDPPYLTKHRCIDRDVVTAFVQEKMLYEDDPHHNCVFVGLDENGEARHAHLRSTGSQGKVFRINVESSDIKHSFHKNGTDRSLYVFEAPIDLLSHITLYPAGWLEHSYVACCGTSIQPVLERLRQNPKLDTVYLCLDNDEAGEDACDGMLDTLEDMGYDVERLRPEGKDWNDDLRAKRGKAKTPTA